MARKGKTTEEIVAHTLIVANALGGALKGAAWGGNIGQGLGALAAGVCAAFTGGTCTAAMTGP